MNKLPHLFYNMPTECFGDIPISMNIRKDARLGFWTEYVEIGFANRFLDSIAIYPVSDKGVCHWHSLSIWGHKVWEQFTESERSKMSFIANYFLITKKDYFKQREAEKERARKKLLTDKQYEMWNLQRGDLRRGNRFMFLRHAWSSKAKTFLVQGFIRGVLNWIRSRHSS